MLKNYYMPESVEKGKEQPPQSPLSGGGTVPPPDKEASPDTARVKSVTGVILRSALSRKRQIPPTPFVEGGALMDPSFTKRGWGDLETTRAICGLGGVNNWART